MSDILTPGGIVATLIDIGAGCGKAIGISRMPIRLSLAAAVIPALFTCNVALAQVGGMAPPTPAIGATSPLGISADPSVSPTGIPLGSTELASPGISPAPTSSTGTIAMPGSGTACSTAGIAPSGMFGSTATFDGGGTTMGTGMPATAATAGMPTSSGMSTSSGVSATSGLETAGMSGMCGSGSSSMASSSAPTSPTTPGGLARTGIPLGSTEIGNLGVSTAAAVPMVGVAPTVGMVAPPATLPTVSTAPASTTGITPFMIPGSNPSGSALVPTGAGSQ
jgi:hypothetical protein